MTTLITPNASLLIFTVSALVFAGTCICISARGLRGGRRHALSPTLVALLAAALLLMVVGPIASLAAVALIVVASARRLARP